VSESQRYVPNKMSIGDDGINAIIQIVGTLCIPLMEAVDKITFIKETIPENLGIRSLGEYMKDGVEGVIKYIVSEIVSLAANGSRDDGQKEISIRWILVVIHEDSELYEMFNKFHALPLQMLYMKIAHLYIESDKESMDEDIVETMFEDADKDTITCVPYVCEYINAVIDDVTLKTITMANKQITDYASLMMYVAEIIKKQMRLLQPTGILKYSTFMTAVMFNPYWNLQYFLLLPLPKAYT
jgi:hypothetical protein